MKIPFIEGYKFQNTQNEDLFFLKCVFGIIYGPNVTRRWVWRSYQTQMSHSTKKNFACNYDMLSPHVYVLFLKCIGIIQIFKFEGKPLWTI